MTKRGSTAGRAAAFNTNVVAKAGCWVAKSDTFTFALVIVLLTLGTIRLAVYNPALANNPIFILRVGGG